MARLIDGLSERERKRVLTDPVAASWPTASPTGWHAAAAHPFQGAWTRRRLPQQPARRLPREARVRPARHVHARHDLRPVPRVVGALVDPHQLRPVRRTAGERGRPRQRRGDRGPARRRRRPRRGRQTSADVLGALARCSDPEAWQALDRLLRSAGRQEGLRQAILETTDLAHPGARRLIVTTVVDEGYTRFASAIRAVGTWWGEEFEVRQDKQVRTHLATWLPMLDAPPDDLAALRRGRRAPGVATPMRSATPRRRWPSRRTSSATSPPSTDWPRCGCRARSTCRRRGGRRRCRADPDLRLRGSRDRGGHLDRVGQRPPAHRSRSRGRPRRPARPAEEDPDRRDRPHRQARDQDRPRSRRRRAPGLRTRRARGVASSPLWSSPAPVAGPRSSSRLRGRPRGATAPTLMAALTDLSSWNRSLAERALSGRRADHRGRSPLPRRALTRKASGQRTLALRFLDQAAAATSWPPPSPVCVPAPPTSSAEPTSSLRQPAQPPRGTRSSSRRRACSSYAPPTGRHRGAPRRAALRRRPPRRWRPTCSTSSTPWPSTSSATPRPRSSCTPSRSLWAPCTGSRGGARTSCRCQRCSVSGGRRPPPRSPTAAWSALLLADFRPHGEDAWAAKQSRRILGKVRWPKDEDREGPTCPGLEVVEALARTVAARLVGRSLPLRRAATSRSALARQPPPASGRGARGARREAASDDPVGQRDDVDCRDTHGRAGSRRAGSTSTAGACSRRCQLEEVWATLRWLDEPEGSFDPVDGTYVAGNLREPGVYAWGAERAPAAPFRKRPPGGIALSAYDAGIAARADVIDSLLGGSPHRERDPLPEGDPTPAARVDPARRRARRRGRGARRAGRGGGRARRPPGTDDVRWLAQISSVPGVQRVTDLLLALGTRPFARGYVTGGSREESLSRLVRASWPVAGEDDVTVDAALGRVPEKRLIEFAVYAPQWSGHVERVARLVRPRVLPSGGCTRTPRTTRWTVPAEIREEWARRGQPPHAPRGRRPGAGRDRRPVVRRDARRAGR